MAFIFCCNLAALVPIILFYSNSIRFNQFFRFNSQIRYNWKSRECFQFSYNFLIIDLYVDFINPDNARNPKPTIIRYSLNGLLGYKSVSEIIKIIKPAIQTMAKAIIIMGFFFIVKSIIVFHQLNLSDSTFQFRNCAQNRNVSIVNPFFRFKFHIPIYC